MNIQYVSRKKHVKKYTIVSDSKGRYRGSRLGKHALERIPRTMIVGALNESFPGETRVAITPISAKALSKLDLQVLVEHGAGEQAGCEDEFYRGAGAELTTRDEVFERSDILLMVRGMAANPEGWEEDFNQTSPGQVIIGQMDPYNSDNHLEAAARRELSVVSLELIPRISRAQSMDALTSQANIGGYKAAILAAERLPKILPMMMTAAGTVRPASVFVIGAGVAGLQAIATAQRLGAQVEGYDIRLEVKEQVESLGADFVELDLETEEAEGEEGYAREMDEEFYAQQRERLTEVLNYTDIAITTANIPGKPAPELISEEMVEVMPSGSVIVDLAAANGGNCELTVPDEEIRKQGVTILGPTNLPATVPHHASQLYASNLKSFLSEFTEDGTLALDREDEIVDSTLLTHEGEVLAPHRSEEPEPE